MLLYNAVNSNTIPMKTITLILSSLICFSTLASCNGKLPDNPDAVTDTLALTENIETKRAIKFLPIPDYQRNMVQALLPVPTDWNYSKSSNKDIFLEGANGVNVFHVMGENYFYSTNTYIAQDYRAQGFKVKPFEPIENDVTFLKKALAAEGWKYLKQYDLPQLAQQTYNYDQQFFKAIPERKSIWVMGTEWVNEKGVKALIVIKHFGAETQHSYYWGYQMEMVQAPDTFFNQAKQDFLNAKLNMRTNNQWLQTLNNENRRQAQINEQNHNARMTALKAEGQRIIAAGKSHDAMTTRNHQKFMDGLLDKINVTDPASGNTYKVDLGSKHYWINDQNQLITTDDPNLNPNQSNYSSGNWVEAQINY